MITSDIYGLQKKMNVTDQNEISSPFLKKSKTTRNEVFNSFEKSKKRSITLVSSLLGNLLKKRNMSYNEEIKFFGPSGCGRLMSECLYKQLGYAKFVVNNEDKKIYKIASDSYASRSQRYFYSKKVSISPLGILLKSKLNPLLKKYPYKTYAFFDNVYKEESKLNFHKITQNYVLVRLSTKQPVYSSGITLILAIRSYKVTDESKQLKYEIDFDSSLIGNQEFYKFLGFQGKSILNIIYPEDKLKKLKLEIEK